MDYKKLCNECSEMLKKKGEWCCHECFDQKCSELDECPLGLTSEEVDESNKIKIKIDHGAKAETKRKPTERKPKKADDEKKALIRAVCSGLQGENIEFTVTNDERSIDFSYNGAEYTINLIKHRQKKTK